jgi:hypothetical protein
MLDCQIGNAAGPSVATVDQADIRALGSGMTAVRRGAASVQDPGCRLWGRTNNVRQGFSFPRPRRVAYLA